MANTLKFGNGEWATKEGYTLAYNDENGNFKPLPFDFSRSTTATRVNKEGLIETVSNNEPRIDFLNDSNGALLLEPSRSNLVTYSEDFTQWSKSSATITETSSSISTFGNYSLFETTSLGGSINLSTSVSGVVTFSIYGKKGTAKAMRIRLDASVDANCWVNLENGTEVGTNTGQSLEITDVNNGFYRIAFTANVTNLSLIRLYTTEATTTADEIGNIYIYAAQLEEGSYATSYIPTQGSIGTRLLESCSQTPPSGIIGQTEGTMFMEFKFNYSDSATQVLFKANQSTDANSVGIEVQGTTIKGLVNSGGANIATITGTIATGTIKAALAYKTNDMAFYVNGTQVGVDTSGSIAFAGLVNILTIGQFLLSGSSFFPASRPFNQVQLYNTRLSNTELQTLTTI